MRPPPERCEEGWKKLAYSRERTHLVFPSGTRECVVHDTSHYVYLVEDSGRGGRTLVTLESRHLRDDGGAMGPTSKEKEHWRQRDVEISEYALGAGGYPNED